MIRAVHSNRTEQLLESLARNLRQWRTDHDPFEPACLIVPNRSVETWVRFQLARTLGFAGNIKSHYLRPFLSSLLDDTAIHLLDSHALRGFVLSILFDTEALNDPPLARVKEYVLRDGAPEAAGVEMRRFQLARQVARLFEEYSYSRREMLDRWPDGPLFGDTPGGEDEVWQRALWLRVLKLAARQRRTSDIRWPPLHAVIGEVRSGRTRLPGLISLFGLSHVAPMFHALFQEIGRRTDLVSYTLNPCADFWEDLTRSPRGESEKLTPDTMPALRLWGRPGGENVKQWNAADENAVESFGDVAPDGTLLHRFQQDVLHPMDSASAPAGASDGSIRILACKSVRREAEAIARDVWALMEADQRERKGQEPLRFNDIAIIVPPRDSERYFTHLPAALSEAHGIPCNIVDLPFLSTSRAADALRLLLELPLSRFTRADVLRLLTHPLVIARYPEADPAQWIDWCDRLGIVHGADHDDHHGTYIDEDILNWDQGLRRLTLGAFLPGMRSGLEHPFSLPTGEYLPEEVAQSNQAAASQFALLARSLLQDSRFARTARLSLADWGRFFQGLLETYVQAPLAGDERDIARCARALHFAFEIPMTGEVPFQTAQALALDALADISGARGQHLAHGVVLSTAQPMRAVPFRAVFMAGLGEGSFPSTDRASPLDLRRLTHQPGDVSPAEKDRYLFLEALLAARDCVRLSWVSRDPLTGDPLEPSSVICELLEILHDSYLGPVDSGKPLWLASPLVVDEPVWRHKDEHPTLPAARAEADALDLRKDWKKTFGDAAVPEQVDDLRPRVAPGAWDDLGARLALCPPVARLAPREEPPVFLTLSRLRRFLECPLQGHASAILRLEEEEEDARALEDEAFATDLLRATTLVSDTFLKAFEEAKGDPGSIAFEHMLDERARLEVLKGRVPAGVFGESERREQLAVIRLWARLLQEHLRASGASPRFRRWRFGRADIAAEAELTVDPLVLDLPIGGRMRRVEISGTTQPLLLDRVESVLLQWRFKLLENTNPYVERRKRLLRSFLDYVALRAAGEVESPLDVFLAVTDSESTDSLSTRFGPLSRDGARNYLSTLVEDLLGSAHEYRLPCESVFTAWEDHSDDYTRPPKESSSRWGPVRHADRYPTPTVEEARKYVERRFKLFRDLLELDKEGEQ